MIPIVAVKPVFKTVLKTADAELSRKRACSRRFPSQNSPKGQRGIQSFDQLRGNRMIVSEMDAKTARIWRKRDILAIMLWHFPGANGVKPYAGKSSRDHIFARARPIRAGGQIFGDKLMWIFWHCAELSDRKAMQVWLNPNSRAHSPRAE
ncbi:MAG: hypothetical protein GXP03_02370 [Alphaproteobacteria bacterium]|nr:hypothetical protein [Alphaproteobacteria bacterium]